MVVLEDGVGNSLLIKTRRSFASSTLKEFNVYAQVFYAVLGGSDDLIKLGAYISITAPKVIKYSMLTQTRLMDGIYSSNGSSESEGKKFSSSLLIMNSIQAQEITYLSPSMLLALVNVILNSGILTQ